MDKVILIEGSQGVYKSSVTNILREKLTSTNLLRLSGVKGKTKQDEVKSFSYHANVLNMVADSHECGLNWVFDRSYLSDRVYAKLGYKDYDFEYYSGVLAEKLSRLASYYDVFFFVLTADEESFKERLCRDKGEYQSFSVESSINQQNEYLNEIEKLDKRVATFVIDTSNKTSVDVAEMIIKIIN